MEQSFIAYIENSIKNNWDLDALTDYKGATLQYKDVARKIEKLHIIFEESGIRKGDKIAVCGRNSSHWGVTFLATLTYGAVIVPILHDFIADIFGVSAAQRVQRIRQYGDAFGLTQDLAQSIGAYSHGMKQKLAIIAALLHEPKLILMDEPFVGLDPLASHQLKIQMKAFCAQGGAIFFSTHVLEVAEKLCDRVAILRKGQLVREGAMEQVRGDDTLEEVFLELEDTGGAL